jgi:hypothetical protein
MARKGNTIQTDTAGHAFIEVPSENGAGKMRVSVLSDFYSPPVDEDGNVDVRAAAEDLQQEVIGGTLQFRSHLESGTLGLPVEINLTSKDELEAMIRAIRKVFKEGLKRSNDVREAGLERCKSLLAQEKEVDKPRKPADRRSSERRGDERRVWYKPPAIDYRKDDRRNGSDRRAKGGRRVA